jgi:hypothetical protein
LILITETSPQEKFLKTTPINYTCLSVNTKQYVVDDSSVYVWSIESLRDDVMKLNYTAKAALEAHMKRKGHDMTGVWTQMDDAITKLLLDNERNVVREASEYLTRLSFPLTAGCESN